MRGPDPGFGSHNNIEHIRKAMSQAIKLAVPLVVDVDIGDNWDEAY